MKLRKLSDTDAIDHVLRRVQRPCPSKAEWLEWAKKHEELKAKLRAELKDNRTKFIRDYKPWMTGVVLEV